MHLSFSIKKSPAEVLDYLTDMQKFASAHPVITKIDATGTNSYLVYETLRVASILFSFTYPVTVTANRQENIVVMQATVMKITKIEMTFTVKPSGEFTIVEEDIRFKSLLPIKSALERIFKKQHAQFFKNMEMP
jgi:carbon monoxide dehydrogenase subunit G